MLLTGEVQNNLLVVDVDKKQIKKTGWKSEVGKRNDAYLRDEPHRLLYGCRVKEIMSDNQRDIRAASEKVRQRHMMEYAAMRKEENSM